MRKRWYFGGFALAAILLSAAAFGEPEVGPAPEMAFGDPVTAPEIAAPPASEDATLVTSLSSPVKVEKPAGEEFSLWDLLSRFFELKPPGDPNKTDKLRLTVGTTIGYDTNVLTTYEDPIASSTAGLNGTMTYNFGTERLKIGADLALGTTYYDSRPGDKTDFNGAFNGRILYQANRRLQFAANLGVFYASQPNPTLIGGVSRFSGDYYGGNIDLSVSYSLRPRLSVRTGYRQSTVRYAEEDQNEALAFTDQTYFVGFDYLLSPRITLTTEYRYNPLSYDEADLDSTGQIFTVGFITTINPRLTWTLQAGAEGRTVGDAGDGQGDSTYFGPFLETDVSYNFAPGSSLTASVRYGTEPSGFAGISIRETLRGSLALTYAFTPRLTGSVYGNYQHDNYDQPGEINDFTQQFFTAGVGLGFQVNPALSLSARYDYSQLATEQVIDGYTRGIVTLGLQIIF